MARKIGPYLLFDCDSKGRYPRAVRTLIPVETCRLDGPAAELLVPESRPAGDLHLRPRPHTEPVNNTVVRLSSLSQTAGEFHRQNPTERRSQDYIIALL